jgi:hypothetical protein
VIFRAGCVVAVFALTACGSAADRCAACTANQLCEPATGRCVDKQAMTCVPGCVGSTPVCDTSGTAPRCVVCNATQGCSGIAPRCDAAANRCVECLASTDCRAGSTCSAAHACMSAPSDGGTTHDAGTVDAGVVDAGSMNDGGSNVSDGGNWVNPNGPQWNGTGSCAPQDGGAGGSCVPNCAEGFHCQGNQCVLNGGNGPVQVTLRFNLPEDVDLHVREPTATGGYCEIYYTNRMGSCVGSLDLDSNPGCSIDNVDIENVIYPGGVQAPHGLYSVYVDHYRNCSTSVTAVPFEVEARFNGNTVGVCGLFTTNDPDWDDQGGANAGRLMMTFVVP